MSFYDDASLVFLAGGAAGKDGKAYSLKPTDGSGDFTFTRGTNLTATRVGKDGYIEKGREQLLYNTVWSGVSEDTAPTGWTGAITASGTFNTTSTSGQIRFTCGALDRSYIQGQAFTTDGPLAMSVYVDEVHTACRVSSVIGYGGVSSTVIGYYEDGVKINLTDNVQAGKRYSLVINRTDSDNGYPRIGVGIDNVREGDITLSRPQFEIGLAATAYIENTSTSATATAGLLEDEPRFDYSGGGCPALLMEPQRVNLVPHSEYHSDSTYGNNQVTTTDNEAVSPEGVQNAAKIVLDSGTNASNGGHYLTFSSTAGTTYTISVFAKAGEMRYFTFTYGSTSAGGGHFDLQEGTLLGTITNASYSDVTADIEDYGNGWYRLVVSLTDSLSVAGRFLSMKPSPSASVPSYNNYSSTGDGTSGAYIYGFQLEEGSYATSYIPTYGSAATREDDNPIVSSAEDIIDITQGTLFIDATIDSNVDTEIYLMKFDGVDFNDTLYLYRATVGRIQGVYRIGGTAYKEETTGGAISGRFKVAFAYDSNNDCTLYLNGSKVGSSFSIPTPSVNLTAIRLGGFNDTLAKQSGLTHQSLYFPTRISNNDCEIITGTSYASFASMASTLSYTQYE